VPFGRYICGVQLHVLLDEGLWHPRPERGDLGVESTANSNQAPNSNDSFRLLPIRGLC